jgi:hypothetical protein
MDFTATKISTEDITPEQVKAMIADARQQIEGEEPLKNSKISFFKNRKESSILNSLD